MSNLFRSNGVTEYLDTDFRMALDDILQKRNVRSVLLFTGGSSYDRSRARDYFEQMASRVSVTRYSGFGTNPSHEALVAALEQLKGAHVDMIIAVGGGSVMDFAKLVAIYLENPQALDAGFPDISGLPVAAPITAVPTTAGSGSDATHFAVMYRDGSKYSLASPQLQPAYVVVDPELTTGMSAAQTATSGMDALCQAMESLWARNATARSMEYARHAITLILPHLEQFCHHPDSKSRRAMALGAFFAGKAINISKTTGPHAMSYYLTDHLGVPHGEAVAMNMEFFIRKNLPVVSKNVRRDFFTLFEVSDADALAGGISRLKKNMGLRMDVSEAGLTSRSSLKKYLDSINEERMGNNPARISTSELFDVYYRNINGYRK